MQHEATSVHRETRCALASEAGRNEWFFQGIAAIARVAPTGLVALVGRWVLGPSGVARCLPHLRDSEIRRLAQAQPIDFVARVALVLDPPTREWVLPKLPFETVLGCARELVSLQAFEATAEFAELLPRATLKQLVVQLDDPGSVAHIAGHLSADTVAHVLAALSPRLAADLVEAVYREGYAETASALGPRLAAPHRAEMLPLLSEPARAAVTADLPRDA
ncbi:hypothetical protein [Algiphilus sp.]|uniref:hypothetical protein n=1 Tax=Algiphilus sp. TaxID=1872431 RepID=UPI003C3E42C0